MVGVPGKSQGCNTCRRRKVKCDLEKPHCRRCVSSARQCEGYERYAVFINRGQQGLQKRERLEEARIPTTSIPSALGFQYANTPLNFSPSPRQANETQLISSFWETYCASATRYPAPTEPAWLYRSISSATTPTTVTAAPSMLLKQALLSLAYIRIGRLNDDQALIIRGQQIYGQSLRLMQHALRDPVLAHNDDILVAARCMVLYESFESTSGDMAAWENHILGIARIIHLRGVHQTRDPISRSVLESIRYNVMIVSLMRSTSCFLGESEWLTVPWAGVSKSLDQRLFDYGFTLAYMMQRSETISMSTSLSVPSQHRHQELHQSASKRQTIIDILEQTLSCYIGLANLRSELLATRRQKLRVVNPPSIQSQQLYDEDTTTDEQHMHLARADNDPQAISFAILLALELSFSIFATALVQHLPDDHDHDYAHGHGHDHGRDLGHDPTRHSPRDLFAQLAEYMAPARRLQLGQQLLRHLQLCCAVRSEHLRPRIIFPLNVLRWEMRHRPAEAAQVRALFEAVASRGKFRIAKGAQNAGTEIVPGIVLESER
ncbi:hypothetical protein G647_08855 [Cladophialophora carrionii CBS 160.54]|uniref:Zn(2)-C6 fungal-type domain-containing protein n=1 Tax=Cladophialophora carrionii CBS 160.54 TaxID=1279043 RepID=V9CZL3_9EURO|nr:uncharacterized protein G647_08855 [Cladophialophora carrionii CBS 160.54]ETI19841.1 hypothetical protein G647_08855 [Cladophialophora carrionii CBS 160.54]